MRRQRKNCFLYITQARACVKLCPCIQLCSASHSPQLSALRGGRVAHELRSDSHCQHRKPLKYLAKRDRLPKLRHRRMPPCPRIQTAGLLMRASHEEVPRPSRRKPSHSLGKHPAGCASELQRSFQPEGKQYRKPMKLCARWRRLLMWPRTGRCFVGLHPSVTSCPGRPGM